MRTTIRHVLAATALAGALAAVTVGAASPATAATAPKKGSTCAVSGTTTIVKDRVYVCVSAREGAKPRWGAGLPISKATLAVTDGWAKAADTGMSAAFGMLKNTGAKPVRVVAAYSPYSRVLQLHEVVAKDGSMVMQQKTGGFQIPAKGMTELKPGGNHVMFLKLTKPISAGSLVPVTFVTSDGGLFRTKVLGKVFMGANETYDGGMTGSESSDSMSGM